MIQKWLDPEFWRSWRRFERRGRETHQITATIDGIRGQLVMKAPPLNLKQFANAFDRARTAADRRAVSLRFVRQHQMPTHVTWLPDYDVRLTEAPVAVQDYAAKHLANIARDLLARPKNDDEESTR